MSKIFITGALLLVLIVATNPLSAQNGNRPVPRGLPAYIFNQFDTINHGYYLTAPFKLDNQLADTINNPKSLMILDSKGFLVWYQPLNSVNILDFKYLPVQQQFSFIQFLHSEDVRFRLLDANLQPNDTYSTSNGVDADAHDFIPGSNLTYLLSGSRDSTMDLSGYTFNGVPGSAQTDAVGFVVQEFDLAHQLVFQWNSNDYVHPSEAYSAYGYNAANFDYAHGNSIEECPDGSLLLCFRHINAIYKINRQTGQIEWRLGGKLSDFTFPNDNGFSGQHDARFLPNGNVALFDNANTATPPRKSRAVEYSLDTINWTATKVWEYIYPTPFFSFAMGGHQTTSERLHLINYGINYRPRPSFVLTNDAGDLLTSVFLQDSFVSYRSYVFDFPFDVSKRPTITCDQNNGIVTLSAPPGFDRYEWSTGESGPTISTTQAGTYQVWAGNGFGMYGSQPFILTDVNSPCLVNTNYQPDPVENKRILGYFDLLGRQVANPVVGNLYIVQYSNGSAMIQLWKD